MLSLLFSFFLLKDLPALQFSFDKLLSIFWLSQKLEITLETVEVLESKKHLYSCFLFLLLFSHGKAFRFLKLCKERETSKCFLAHEIASRLENWQTLFPPMPPSKQNQKATLSIAQLLCVEDLLSIVNLKVTTKMQFLNSHTNTNTLLEIFIVEFAVKK